MEFNVRNIDFSLYRREIEHSDELSRIQQRQKQEMTELQNTLEQERYKLVNL